MCLAFHHLRPVRRSPFGLRGLKWDIDLDEIPAELSRSPLGLRGFKYSLKFIKTLDYKSRSPLWLCELDSGMM